MVASNSLNAWNTSWYPYPYPCRKILNCWLGNRSFAAFDSLTLFTVDLIEICILSKKVAYINFHTWAYVGGEWAFKPHKWQIYCTRFLLVQFTACSLQTNARLNVMFEAFTWTIRVSASILQCLTSIEEWTLQMSIERPLLCLKHDLQSGSIAELVVITLIWFSSTAQWLQTQKPKVLIWRGLLVINDIKSLKEIWGLPITKLYNFSVLKQFQGLISQSDDIEYYQYPIYTVRVNASKVGCISVEPIIPHWTCLRLKLQRCSHKFVWIT